MVITWGISLVACCVLLLAIPVLLEWRAGTGLAPSIAIAGLRSIGGGEIPEFTGVSAPYEPPLTPDLHVRPEDGTAEEVAQRILSSILGI